MSSKSGIFTNTMLRREDKYCFAILTSTLDKFLRLVPCDQYAKCTEMLGERVYPYIYYFLIKNTYYFLYFLKAGQAQRPSGMGELDKAQMGIIPANTQLQTSLMVTPGDANKPVSTRTLKNNSYL